MKNMLRKLNFKRGASITLALLIFLLSALAGVTALTMAMANIGRYSHAQDDQQPYYTVSSAALLMVDLLDGTQYISPTVKYCSIREWEHVQNGNLSDHPSREYNTLNVINIDQYNENYEGPNYLNKDWTKDNESTIEIYHTVPDEEGKPKEEVYKDNPLMNSSLSLKLLTKLKDYCDKLVPYCVVPQEWYSSLKFKKEVKDSTTGEETTKVEYIDSKIKVEHFRPREGETLNYAFTIKADSLSTVSARLVMEDSYNLILSFSCRESIGDSGYAFYAINVYWTATVTTTTKSEPTKFTYTDNNNKGSMTSEQTKYVTVRWDKSNVTISRGEAYEKEDTTQKN